LVDKLKKADYNEGQKTNNEIKPCWVWTQTRQGEKVMV